MHAATVLDLPDGDLINRRYWALAIAGAFVPASERKISESSHS